MKKTSLFLVVVLAAAMAFSMASCASFMDEVVMGTFREVGNEFTQNASIYGIWRLNAGDSFLFDTGGSGTRTTSSGTYKFAWSSSGNRLTITPEGSASGSTYIFNIDGDTLTLQLEGTNSISTLTR